MKFSAEKPAHRQSAKRYAAAYDNKHIYNEKTIYNRYDNIDFICFWTRQIQLCSV
jgi:hypothetical protein